MFWRILYETISYLYHKLNEKKAKQLSFSLRHRICSKDELRMWLRAKHKILVVVLFSEELTFIHK
jgi:hypothetical protein